MRQISNFTLFMRASFSLLSACRLLHLLYISVGCLLSNQVTAGTILELQQAEFVVQSTIELPADDLAWSPIRLPDQWKLSRPGFGGDVWYRFSFEHEAKSDEVQAVYLPRLCMNAAVYLNGALLGSGGSFSQPVARNWNRPLLFTFAPGLLKVGNNHLLIRVYSPAFSLGSLNSVFIGNEETLRQVYDRSFFLHITLNQTATLIITVMGVFMLVLWWRRRQDTMYGYFGLSSLVWAFNSTNLFIRDNPFQANLWETLINASFQVFISFLMLAILRFLGLKQRLLELGLWAILIGSPISLLLLPANILIPVSMFWHLLTLLSSMTVCAFLLREVWRKPCIDSLLLVGALGVNLIFGVHDWLKQASILNSGDIHWIHYGAPVFFLVVGSILINRFVLALNQYEHLNADLEQRVQFKHAELESQYSSMQAIEKQKAILEERERVFRDLHDDVGAKLLGLVISAQRANLPKEADLARSALQDLRDVVSRSNQEQTPLNDLLADWRIETEQRVKAAGLSLEWQFPDFPASLTVNAQNALNLSRIVREAITNVLRHAEASRIYVSTRLIDERFCISIEDDGTGFSPNTLRPHRGMSSMQARATTLNGVLQWNMLNPQGCRVELCVPPDTFTPT